MLDSKLAETCIDSFDDDIVMECDGVLAEINYESFQECIGGTMEEVIRKNEKAQEVNFSSLASVH